MPSYLDLAVLAIVLVSALLSMMRGFSREVLAIASWAAAAAAAYYFYPVVVPYLSPYIHKEVIAQAVAATLVFFGTLIVVSLFTVRLSDAILDSKVGALDRSLGFLFGVARGFLLAVVAFAIFNWLVSEKQQPEWVRNARTRPVLTDTAERIVAMLPEDAAVTIDAWIKSRANAVTNEEPTEESVAPSPDNPPAGAPAPASAPAATPQKKADGSTTSSGSSLDKQKLDALINKNVPPPAPPAPAAVNKH
jgi:membrane protein required for colicin V production